MVYGNIVLASSKSGFIPKSIEWFTQSKFSHSFVIVPSILKIPMCIEAAEGGVDFTTFDSSYLNNPDQGYEVWSINIDKEKKDLAIISILRDLETSYGFLEYPWFIWRRICLFFGKDIKSQNNWNMDGMICSQLCCAYLKACGLEHIFKGYGKGSVAPQDLRNIFVSYPKIFKLTKTVRL